jgi:hypothetical protein
MLREVKNGIAKGKLFSVKVYIQKMMEIFFANVLKKGRREFEYGRRRTE